MERHLTASNASWPATRNDSQLLSENSVPETAEFDSSAPARMYIAMPHPEDNVKHPRRGNLTGHTRSLAKISQERWRKAQASKRLRGPSPSPAKTIPRLTNDAALLAISSLIGRS